MEVQNAEQWANRIKSNNAQGRQDNRNVSPALNATPLISSVSEIFGPVTRQDEPELGRIQLNAYGRNRAEREQAESRREQAEPRYDSAPPADTTTKDQKSLPSWVLPVGLLLVFLFLKKPKKEAS